MESAAEIPWIVSAIADADRVNHGEQLREVGRNCSDFYDHEIRSFFALLSTSAKSAVASIPGWLGISLEARRRDCGAWASQIIPALH